MIQDFLDFCRKRPFLIGFQLLLVGISFGLRSFQLNVGADSDIFITNPHTTYNWLGIGRWGLVLSMRIFGTTWYNPFVGAVFATLTMLAFLVVFCYFFHYVSDGKKSLNYYIFSGLFITHPVFVFQWWFQMQAFEIAWSILLVALALLCIFRWLKERKSASLFLGLFFMIWSFSGYQSNVVLYVSGALIGYLLMSEVELSQPFQKGYALRLIGSFVFAFVANEVVTRIFFFDSDYLTMQIAWLQEPLGTVLRSVGSYVGEVVLARSPFMSLAFILLAILFLILFVHDIPAINRKNIWNYLVLAFFAITPFAMTIVLGSRPVYRSQYVLPFVLGSGFLYIIWKSQQYFLRIRFHKWLILALATIFIWQQSATTLRLWYTEDIRFQQDQQVLLQVTADIRQAGLDLESLPTIFVGSYQVPLNPASFEPIEFIGESYFWAFSHLEPRYMWSSLSIIRFANTQGIAFYRPSETEYLLLMEQARAVAQEMPTFPSPGYIRYVDGVIVVHMAESDLQ